MFFEWKFLSCSGSSRDHDMSHNSSQGYAWQLSDLSATEDSWSGAEADEESDEGRPAQPWLVVNLV